MSNSAPLSAPSPAVTLSGDAARRRATLGVLMLLLALPLSWWLFDSLPANWARIMPLEGSAFMAAATLLGAALALAPLTAIVGFALALWHGVESVYLPRRQPSPGLDRVIVAGGLLVWFAPAFGALASALIALSRGRIHFVRPPRDYLLATDPIAFWQGVGFWLIMGSLFAFLAWRYWRNKLLPTAALTS